MFTRTTWPRYPGEPVQLPVEIARDDPPAPARRRARGSRPAGARRRPPPIGAASRPSDSRATRRPHPAGTRERARPAAPGTRGAARRAGGSSIASATRAQPEEVVPVRVRAQARQQEVCRATQDGGEQGREDARPEGGTVRPGHPRSLRSGAGPVPPPRWAPWSGLPVQPTGSTEGFHREESSGCRRVPGIRYREKIVSRSWTGENAKSRRAARSATAAGQLATIRSRNSSSWKRTSSSGKSFWTRAMISAAERARAAEVVGVPGEVVLLPEGRAAGCPSTASGMAQKGSRASGRTKQVYGVPAGGGVDELRRPVTRPPPAARCPKK